MGYFGRHPERALALRITHLGSLMRSVAVRVPASEFLVSCGIRYHLIPLNEKIHRDRNFWYHIIPLIRKEEEEEEGEFLISHGIKYHLIPEFREARV